MEESIALVSPEFFWGFTSFLSASKMAYRKIKVVLGAIIGNESVGLLAVLRTVMHVCNFWFCFPLREEVEHSHAVHSTAASYCDVDGDLQLYSNQFNSLCFGNKNSFIAKASRAAIL
jgi:hypothetical protein